MLFLREVGPMYTLTLRGTRYVPMAKFGIGFKTNSVTDSVSCVEHGWEKKILLYLNNKKNDKNRIDWKGNRKWIE